MSRTKSALVAVAVSSLLRGSAANAEEAREPSPAVSAGEPVALGRVQEAGPHERALYLLAGAGYGYTGDVLGQRDRHDRWSGRLMADARVLPWLALTLRLDGRYDRHSLPGQATDVGWVGDPRLEARVDRALGPRAHDGHGWSVGARMSLWFPGATAPSFRASAISPELVGALTYAAPTWPVSLSLNAGYRLDHSSNTASNAGMLSASDRLALGLNAFDAVLVGVGARVGRGRHQGFAEARAELLVGPGHPAVAASPMFLTVGARSALDANLRLEAAVELSPSERPNLGASAPLVAVPPRFAAWIGVAYRFGNAHTEPPREELTAAAPAVAPPRAPATNSETAPTAEKEGPARGSGASGEGGGKASAGGQLRVLVRSFRGQVLEAEIVLRRLGEPAAEPQHLPHKGARATLDVAPGTYEIQIEANGYEPQRRRVQVEDNGVTMLNVELRQAK